MPIRYTGPQPGFSPKPFARVRRDVGWATGPEADVVSHEACLKPIGYTKEQIEELKRTDPNAVDAGLVKISDRNGPDGRPNRRIQVSGESYGLGLPVTREAREGTLKFFQESAPDYTVEGTYPEE